MPTDRRQIPLHWPMAGVITRYGFQNQPPYSTPHALNVRPDSLALTERERGGSRPGLAKAFAEQIGSGNPVMMLATVQYILSDAVQTRIAAVSNGNIYRENPVGTLDTTPVSGATVSSTKLLMAAQRNQVLYIADHSDTPATSAAARAPKKVVPGSSWTASAWTAATAGEIPYGCPILVNWRDRAVLAGGTTNPLTVFMSRQGDWEDWNAAANDVGSAVAINLNNAGLLGDVVTAVAPHGNNCLMIGCATSLHIQRGDPSYGTRDILSQNYGVVDRGAWCHSPDGEFVFLSHAGVKMIRAGCDAGPDSVVDLSRGKIPQEMLAVDKTETTVAMAFDTIDQGIHIWLTPNTADDDNPTTHWWLDWRTRSFWKVTVPDSDFETFAIHERVGYYAAQSTVLLGSRDGYLRAFEHATEEDDGKKFASEVWLGPFGDPSMMQETLWRELAVILGDGSGPVSWSLHQADSPETAFAAGESCSGLWDAAGRNFTDYPRVRGQAIYLKLTCDGTAAWAWESGYAVVERVGRTKL